MLKKVYREIGHPDAYPSRDFGSII
jgi:hypothetical protein